MKILTPLLHRPIATLWTGQALSAVGDQFQRLALIWVSTSLLGTRAGFVAAAETGAVMVAALAAGAWTEEWDPRRTMVGADLLRAMLAAIPLLAASAGVLNLWTLATPCILLATLRGVFDPALQSSLPRLAEDPATLMRTNALMDATSRIARLVGPMLAATLIAVMPAIGLMGLNAVTFLASALALTNLRDALPRATDKKRESPWDGLLRGGRAVAARPPFTYLLVRGGVVNGLWVVAMWLCLPLAVRALHRWTSDGADIGVVGMVMGSYGAGNVIGNILIGEMEPRRPLDMVLLGNLVVGAGLILMALAFFAPAGALVPLLMAAAAATALGGPCSDVPMAALRQTRFDPKDVAAVCRLSLAADYGGMLLATALAPLLLTQVAASTALAICGVGIIAAAAAGLAVLARPAKPP